MQKHYAYMVQCRDGSYYAGYTNDLAKRIDAHNKGKGAKYTSGRGPVMLVYFEEFTEKSEAMAREHAIKKLTRRQKEALISQKQFE